MNYIGYTIALYMGFVFLLLGPFAFLLKYLEDLPKDHTLKICSGPLKIILLGLYFVVFPLLAKGMGKRIALESMSLRESFSATIAEVRLNLSFLPLIGPLFMHKDKAINSVEEDAQQQD